jgi:glycosyltransferase involved in cell wall biosynthesis
MNRLISIIIPTFNNHEALIDILVNIDRQEYKNKEIIVIDDNSRQKANDKGATEQVVMKCKEKLKTNIVYIDTHSQGFALAKARNMGVVNSLGEILFFLDDRYLLEGDFLKQVSIVQDGFWYYGTKRVKDQLSTKKSFIENVSWITKKTFRKFGCFNEQITMYGAMSQDVRERCDIIGLRYEMVPLAIAKCISRSRSNDKKDQIWKAKLLLWKLNN